MEDEQLLIDGHSTKENIVKDFSKSRVADEILTLLWNIWIAIKEAIERFHEKWLLERKRAYQIFE